MKFQAIKLLLHVRAANNWLIFCVGLLLLPLCVPAQSNLRQHITFQAENQRFEDVMLSLADAGRFSFSYNPSLLPVDSLISINAQDESIRNILASMLGQEMEIRQQGNHLVILRTRYTPKPEVPVAAGRISYHIRGQIRDRNGNGLPNATIFDIKSLQSAVTNDNGLYEIDIPSKYSVVGLSVLSKGVVDTTVVVENTDKTLDITIYSSRGYRKEVPEYEGPDGINKRSIVRIVTPQSGIERSTGRSLSAERKAQISIIPFTGTNMKMSGMVANQYSFNVLAGYNGAVDKLEIGGLVNIDRFYVHGAQVAGLANAVGRETNGIQLAGLFNTNLGPVEGVQMAGVTNLVLDSLSGLQVAGVINVTEGRTRGVQLAGVSNLAVKDVDGVQLAGVLNIGVKDVNSVQMAGVMNFGRNVPGGQLAGVMNTSYGRVSGIQLAGVLNSGRTLRSLQLAGVMNVAIDTVHGAQLAAVFNFARKNHGFQLGLMNMGDSAAGASVGLLSLYLRGYNKIELQTNETLPYSIRVKLGANPKFYNIFGLGTQGFGTGEIWGYTYGIGTAFSVGKRRRNMINFDLTATDLQDDDTWFEELTLMGRFGVFYAQALGKRFRIYGGPVLSALFFDPAKTDEFPFILEIPPSNKLFHEKYRDVDVIGWMGFEIGLRIL